jgi:hypothetical protein
MAEEKKTKHRPFEGMLPEEAREHAQAARRAWRQSIVSLFPPEFIEQRRTARKEALMAVRSLIDSAIERLEPPK